MLKGYLIEKYNTMTDAYTCNRLVDEAKNARIDLKIVGIHDTAVVDGYIYNCGCKLEKRDFLINRYKWGDIKDELNHLASRTYNSIDAYNQYINKYQQVKNLESDAFAMPKFVLATSLYDYEKIAGILGTPFVAKGLESSMGQEIFLIKELSDYAKLSDFGMNKEWLFEEFVETSFGRDMRFYCIRGQAVACMKRQSKGDFRANVALGASVESFEISPEIRKIGSDIYKQTGLDFLGIDLLFGKNKPYFCEINVMPGLEGIEKASGYNIAKMIIDTIKGDFS